MPIYEFGTIGIAPLKETTFGSAGMKERGDLQRLLRENIEVIAPNTLVISEEFGGWEDSRRRIDLLAIDRDANLVVIELKRTEDAGHMELQAIRYAAMVARMRFDQAVQIYRQYLQRQGQESDNAIDHILKFLDWEQADEPQFARKVRIILVSANFSREVTSSVLWLNEGGLDIQCIRLIPYQFNGRVLVEVQPLIPLPEMGDYLVRIREKSQEEREVQSTVMDLTRFDVWVGGQKTADLTKRHAFLTLCRYLCDKGVTPDEIAAVGPRSPGRVVYAVNGLLTADEFSASARERAAAEGTTFDPRRWFCGAGELVQSSGKTYAFSNQWGGDRWRTTMDRLCQKFGQFDIRFSEAA
jgi:hypothetical protein